MIKLKELRESQKISQSKLSTEIGVSRSTIAMWENGCSQPDNDTLAQLAKYFNVSVDYLLDNNIEAEEITHAREIIKRLHEEQDIEIETIEKTLGINYATFRSWLNGFGDFFSSATGLSKIADLFSVTVDFLLGRTETTDSSLSDVEFALYGEVKELTDDEKEDVLKFIQFTKSKRTDANDD